MKKKLLIIVMTVAVILSLSACTKSKEEKLADELGLEELYRDDELGDIAKQMAIEEAMYEEQLQAKQEAQATKEEIIASYKKFDADPGWKDVIPEYGAVQIDDMLYIGGCTIDEMIKQIESSSVEYTFEYNPDKLVQGTEQATISILRDEFPWFTIEGFNFSDDMGSIKDCVVTNIIPDNAALSCCRFIDGRSIQDFTELSYDNVTLLKTDLFSNEKWFYSSESNKVKNADGEYHDTIEEVFTLSGYVNPLFTHTGYDVDKYVSYTFVINADSGMVENLRFYSGSGTYRKSEAIQFNSFTDISQDDLNAFISLAEEELIAKTGAKSFEGLAIFLNKYMGKNGLFFSYKIALEDGTEKYAYVEYIGSGTTPIGEISYTHCYYETRDIGQGNYDVKSSMMREYIDEIAYPN